MDIPTRVLVVYATENGSTGDVAHYIADKLRTGGFDVDVFRASTAPDPGSYEALVLGSAVRDGAWLPAARNYVRGNKEAIRHIDVWMFSVGTTAGLRGPLGRRAKAVVPRDIATLCAAVLPHDYRSFGGLVERSAMTFKERIAHLAAGGRYGDLRDWLAIGGWATEIANTVPRWQPFDVVRQRRSAAEVE
ncbi:flavodoxin [Antrihabitans sp. YC3-6]|uniref:Flavodoxin n=1 Tax=Antrihabitans stalagmiti TaxID=2799499 RepID=A0A934U5V7_9NOCA|nr:flavodoxin domain-containing protein [Antrihabitans stalagmiti]MBJ8341283.1 flavodoxin [Antrihabitans stalagmiti]